MTASIKTRIIKIGSSQGIRIPQALLEQTGLSAEVEIEAQAGQLIVRPVRHPREGWDAAFALMAQRGDDCLEDNEPLLLTEWEANEWQW